MDPKRTREALAGDLGDARAVVRWAVDLFEECENPECERGMVHDGFDGLHNKQVECPSCMGRGFSLNQERVERAARLFHPGPWWDDPVGFPAAHPLFIAEAEAAILAFLLEGENGD